MSNPEQEFQAAIAAAGLTPPEYVVADRNIHRFSGDGRRGDKSGWYTLHLDGVPAGAFGCWRADVNATWCGKSNDTMTQAERDAHRKRIESMRAQRDAEQAQRQQQAQVSAATILANATPARTHEYLAAKGIQPHGVRCDGVRLLIPMRDTAGAVHSLQSVAPDGDKRFHPGGKVTGCYYGIGKPDGTLIVCEGFATGASIHECTGHAVAVAFNAGNLQPVAEALHAKYPALQIIIAADDDHLTEGNPGMTKATAAAQAVAGLIAVPAFPEGRPDKATDFNDLHRLAGIDAVKICIDAAAPVARSEQADLATMKGRVEVLLLNGADLNPVPVRWLWPDWLALGKLHILAGAPGQGKTTIALACAAIVTAGGRWPDGRRAECGNVLIWSGEDDPADTLLPRLIAAGADKARCYFVGGTRIDGEIAPFDPARDMAALEGRASQIGGVKLLIVDPVVSAVAGDSHKNTEVRRALQPLVDLASGLDAAVLGISHFSKGGAGSDPASRVVGSIAFTAVARVVLVAAKVKAEDGEDRRILARGKSNIGPDDGGFEYRIEQSEPLPGIHASYIAWGNPVQGSARELLADPETQESGDRSAVDSAKGFLAQALSSGPTPTKTLQAESKDAGVSWASVRRASDELMVVKKKGDGSVWYWSLPMLLNHVAQDAQRLKVEQVEQVDEQVANFGDAEVF